MTKKTGRLAALALLCVFLAGCAAAPPDNVIREDADKSHLISAATDSLTPDTVRATLYFRFGATGYLAPEERLVPVQRNETAEKALVQALINGPAATSSALSPLFPPGTEVLAVSSQEGTLFITFSEALLGRYADEPVDISGAPWKDELPLRRHLCMDALAATLTEAGLCDQIQVLVYRSGAQSSSMRLQAGFYDRGLDETILPPLCRSEEALLTPHNTADAILRSWLRQDWPSLYQWTARDNRPGEQTAISAFSYARILTAYEVSSGAVSPDGQHAVLCVNLTLRSSGQDTVRTGFPLHLIRDGGVWRIRFDHLTDMILENYEETNG